MAIQTEIFKAKRDYEGEYAQYNTPADRVVIIDGVEYDNFPGGTVEVRQTAYGPVVMSTHHVGLVITTRERNYIDDSEFYAVVWNPETKSVGTVNYAYTGMGGTDHNSASADLRDEYRADYTEFLVQQEQAAIRQQEHDFWAEAAYNATSAHKGAQVVVVKGRKVPVGFTGTVIWIGEDGYGKTRVGIKSETGEVQFTAADNAKVIVDADDLPYEADFRHTDEEVRSIAEARISSRGMAGWLTRTQSAPGLVVVA